MDLAPEVTKNALLQVWELVLSVSSAHTHAPDPIQRIQVACFGNDFS
jgi:hypothetical protein